MRKRPVVDLGGRTVNKRSPCNGFLASIAVELLVPRNHLCAGGIRIFGRRIVNSLTLVWAGEEI